MNKKSKSSVTLVLLFLFLLGVAPASFASTTFVRTGDRVTFNYSQALVEPLPNGSIYRQAYLSEFSIDVLGVSTSTVPGVITYTLSYSTYQNSTVTTTSVTASVNQTYIFDPYDNMSYLGGLGFYPFIYTDVATGTKTQMPVTQLITGAPNGTITGTNRINVTVTRPSPYIDVNFTSKPGANTAPSDTFLRFNATNGVLLYGITKAQLLSFERDFTFTLDSYVQGPAPSIPLTLYLVGGSFAVVAIIAVADWAGLLRRRTRTKRKEWKGR